MFMCDIKILLKIYQYSRKQRTNKKSWEPHLSKKMFLIQFDFMILLNTQNDEYEQITIIVQQIQKLLEEMADQRKRNSKEIHGNQNYLNFIKKNHLFLQEEFNDLGSPKLYPLNKIEAQDNSKLALLHREPQEIQETGRPYNSSRVIHDSLSKFQLDNSKYNQISSIYRIEKGSSINYDHNNSTIYDEIQQKNNEIAANLIKNRTKNIKHQAAKELLFHLNKNKSAEHKNKEFRSATIDRYTYIPEPATDLNLKFPIIEKKSFSTIAVDNGKESPQKELKERLKIMEKKQKSKIISKEKQSLEIEGSEIDTLDGSNQQDKIRNIASRFKIREELYGLLPSFKGSTPHQDLLKKSKQMNSLKSRSRIEKMGSPSPPIKQLLEDYLQKNVLVKAASISIQKSNKNFNAIINGENLNPVNLNPSFLPKEEQMEQIDTILDSPGLFKPMQSIEGSQNSIPMNRQQLPAEQQSNKQTEARANKIKKSPVTELKYEGDLSIYELKIRYYREFIFMMNLTYRIFDPIVLKDFSNVKPQSKYKFYLGKGNNYLLVKSLLKRRFWWAVEEDPKKANFVWTQLKINYFYQFQKKAYLNQIHHKLDKDFQLQSPVSPRKKKKKQEIKPQPIKAGAFKAPLPPNDKKIFTNADKKYYDDFLQKADKPEKMLKFSNRLKYFPEDFFKERTEDIFSERVHNHFEFNYFIGNKKALFYNMKQYYDLQHKNVFEVLPLTFHIKNGTSDPQYEAFSRQFKKWAKQKNGKSGIKNIWIVKPGELSNRGQGITVIDEIYQLNNILKKKQKHFNGQQKTYIVQKYIEKPLLYKGRKFDIRHYMMISRLHGVMRAYWFGEGYIRTSSEQYNIEDVGDEMIHLTNDAIQKYCESYGKYEEGNKVSYNEFQRYMDSTVGEGKFSFSQSIYPKMKAIALDAIKATYLKMDPNKTEHNFQIFGLDFMIDSNYEVWMIEVNTNPCLELSSKLLERVIPTMLEQTFRLTLDIIFPPPANYPNSQKYLAPDNPLERLQFQLIFDQARDGKELEELYANAKNPDMGEVDEEDETYESDGKEIELDNEL